ncbi:MAG: single-stranded DNA-binding protein [Candidatus Marinimicrobia bacterium]|nr:single-stranded DNA-binding protein [Candidatus Neomarinimicrobiota bacterium]MCF7827735.1 single-stranded DNA-binding protein [Candidatus Neomarinimicrobiota bacterium]MCF7881465.1 single-stranded DNA-binding protein [Candidatus Neomarinimicrobiota bacterium]
MAYARGSANRVILVGNVGGKPEVRYTNSGAAVANFTMATNETWTDNNGNRQDRTEWHRIVAWRKTAELCEQYVDKGSLLYIEGRLQTRDWEDKNGVKRYTTEVVVDTLTMLGGRGGDTGSQTSSESSAPQPEPEEDEMDDLPF